jgi:ribosomal protein S18 acetylase RimI-like enzyme
VLDLFLKRLNEPTPDSAGKGIARALSVEAINYLVNKGLKHAILYVDADNEKGLKLYGSLGFN